MAGVLGVPVSRPKMVETTALGAAGLAGLHAGVWRSPAEFSRAFAAGRTFESGIGAGEREALLEGWQRAVRGALSASGLSR